MFVLTVDVMGTPVTDCRLKVVAVIVFWTVTT